MKETILGKFLTDTDDTGRFIVKSLKTGRVYAVEPIGFTRTAWGDVDPATKKTTGSYGKKYRGSVDEKDSLITEENGFKNIITLDPGTSPFDYIEQLELQHEEKST